MTTPTIHSGQHGMLRLALRLDAVASGAMGLGLAVTSSFADTVLGVPSGWLLGLGIGLVAWALALAALATRRPVHTGAARAVVAGNAAWVIASAITVIAGWFALTELGTAFVVIQAAAVVVLLGMQYTGLRRIGEYRFSEPG